MLQYILQRLLQAIVVVIVVSMAAFLLVFAAGDPVNTMIPLGAQPQDIAAAKAYFGLDKPLHVQYIRFVENALLHGDMGDSFKYRQDSARLVLDRLPRTALLAVSSLTLAVLVSVPLGILSATHRGGWADIAATAFSLLSISTPAFWLGLLLMLFFAERLRWLPPSGHDQPACLILPVATMATGQIGGITRLLRRCMLDVLNQDYIRTARAKGLTERGVRYGHALRNALIPTVTVVGLNLAQLIGGSVIIETVFAWGGAGWLMMEAISARDLPLLRADVLIMAVFITMINLAVDISYVFLDPRISYRAGVAT